MGKRFTVRKPLTITGESLEPGDTVEFNGTGYPERLVDAGYLVPEPERAVRGEDREKAVSRKETRRRMR